jgi:hypothetical protein
MLEHGRALGGLKKLCFSPSLAVGFRSFPAISLKSCGGHHRVAWRKGEARGMGGLEDTGKALGDIP